MLEKQQSYYHLVYTKYIKEENGKKAISKQEEKFKTFDELRKKIKDLSKDLDLKITSIGRVILKPLTTSQQKSISNDIAIKRWTED